MSEPVKINFKLEQDEDGYPPVAVESLWALPGKNTQEFIIDNVPFFACAATYGDTVRVNKIDGGLWFENIASRSENSLIRVTFFDRTSFEHIKSKLEAIGCATEYSKDYNLLAVTIPESASLDHVQKYLEEEIVAGHIDYEEPILR